LNPYDFHYRAYAKSCLEYYCTYRDPRFHSVAERKGWCAVRDIMGDFNDMERQTIIDIYSSNREERHEAVRRAAKEWKTSDGKIWAFCSEVERRVARKRGLI